MRAVHEAQRGVPAREAPWAAARGIESVSDALIEGHAPGAGVMFPMGETHARVVRIPASEAVLLNSREKAPYLLCLEVIAAPGEEWSHDGSPVSRRTRSTPRHSRESSDSLPLHDMSAPLWSTHDFLSGANGSGGHDPAEMRTSSSAASTFSSANSGPLHPGLNAFAGGLAPRRDGGRGLTRNGSSFSSLSDAHDSIDEDAATAPHEGAEAPRRTSQTSSTLNPNWKPPLSPASTTAAGVAHRRRRGGAGAPASSPAAPRGSSPRTSARSRSRAFPRRWTSRWRRCGGGTSPSSARPSRSPAGGTARRARCRGRATTTRATTPAPCA